LLIKHLALVSVALLAAGDKGLRDDLTNGWKNRPGSVASTAPPQLQYHQTVTGSYRIDLTGCKGVQQA
jgi:hypothetical protein